MEGNENNTHLLRFTLIALAGFAVFLCVGRGTNLMQWFRARSEISAQKNQRELYIREISEMDRKINQLKSSPDSLEKYAREKYQFAREGDDVYLVR